MDDDRDLIGLLAQACARADIHVGLLLDRLCELTAEERGQLTEAAALLRQTAARIEAVAGARALPDPIWGPDSWNSSPEVEVPLTTGHRRGIGPRLSAAHRERWP